MGVRAWLRFGLVELVLACPRCSDANGTSAPGARWAGNLDGDNRDEAAGMFLRIDAMGGWPSRAAWEAASDLQTEAAKKSASV